MLGRKIRKIINIFFNATNSSINVKKSLFKKYIKTTIIADEGDEKNDFWKITQSRRKKQKNI